MGKARAGGLALPAAPVFYPTPEQFQQPLEYIASIRARAERFGMCRIVPPPGWRPPFALDAERFAFRTKVQAMHQLQQRPAGRDPETWRLEYCRFLQREGLLPLPARPMVLAGGELDLCRLFHLVRRHGGYAAVTEGRRWAELLRLLRPERAASSVALGGAPSLLRQLYARHLLAYELHCAGATAPAAAEAATGGLAVAVAAAAVAVQARTAAVNSSAVAKDAARLVKHKPLAAVAAATVPASRSSSPFPVATAAAAGDSEMEIASAFLEFGSRAAAEAPEAKRQKLEAGLAAAVERELRSDQACEQCGSGEHEALMLLCDRCDRGWHLHCLSPPLATVPSGNWYCPSCLGGAEGSAFGFQQGDDYTLADFRRMAERFKRRWFEGLSSGSGGSSSEADLEAEFWRIVQRPMRPVEVLYGSDLDTSACGSGFPRPGDTCPKGVSPREWAAYAASPWNLNNLARCEGSLLRHVDDAIPGVIVPWLYVGMAFAAFCWHYEDHCFYSINYLHWGEPKSWYAVPGSAAEGFEAAMRAAFPDLFEAQPDLLFQLVTMLSPTALRERGVPVYKLVQEPGSFVITFPRSYHAGFNHGFNCAEAVNFAPADWLPWGGAAVERCRLFRKSSILSHEELLCVAAKSGEHGVATQAILREELVRVLLEERRLREGLWRIGVARSRRMAPRRLATRIGKEEDPQCAVCRYYLHLSAVVCRCRPTAAVCLQHAEHLCECPSHCRELLYQYSLADLEDLVTRPASAGATVSVIREVLHGGEAVPPRSQPPMYTPKVEEPESAAAVVAPSACNNLEPLCMPAQGKRPLATPVMEMECKVTAAAALRRRYPARTSRKGCAATAAESAAPARRLRNHAEEAAAWAAKVRVANRTGATRTVAELDKLLEEASEFVWAGHEVSEVRSIESSLWAAKAWAGEVVAACHAMQPTRTTAASSGGAAAPVGAAAGTTAASAGGGGKVPLPLAQVQKLAAKYPPPCLEPSLPLMKLLLASVESMQRRIAEALACVPPMELPDLQRLAQEAALRFPAVELPSRQALQGAVVGAQAWTEVAKKVLAGSMSKLPRRRTAGGPPIASPTAAGMEQLEELQAKAAQLPVVLPELPSVLRALEAVKVWRSQAQELLDGKPPLERVAALLEDAKGLLVRAPEEDDLRSRWDKAQEWLCRAGSDLKECQSVAGGGSAEAARVLAASLRTLLSAGEALQVEVAETAMVSTALRRCSWSEAAAKSMVHRLPTATLVELAQDGEALGCAGELLRCVQQAATSASQWEGLAKGALENGATLEDFKSLLRMVEGIPAKLASLRHVKEVVSKARTWLEKAQLYLKCRGSRRAPGDLLPLSTLLSLVEESGRLPVVLKEADVLRAREAEAREWQARAVALLAQPKLPGLAWVAHIGGAAPGEGTDQQQQLLSIRREMPRRMSRLQVAIDDGLAMGIDHPEIAALQREARREEWDWRACLLLAPAGPKPTLQAVEELLEVAVESQGEQTARARMLVARLRSMAEEGQQWAAQVKATLLHKAEVKTLEELLNVGTTLAVVATAQKSMLEAVLALHRGWQQQVEAVVVAEKTCVAADRWEDVSTVDTCKQPVTYVELELLKAAGELSIVKCTVELRQLTTMLGEAQAWLAQCRRSVAKRSASPLADKTLVTDLLLHMLQSLEVALAAVDERVGDVADRAAKGHSGRAQLTVSGTPRKQQCFCRQRLVPEASQEPSGENSIKPRRVQALAVVHCRSCKDSFHAECLGLDRSPSAEVVCPFCNALQSGRLAIDESRIAGLRITKQPSLESLKELLKAASSLACRLEEGEVLERVVKAAERWRRRVQQLLSPAFGQERGAPAVDTAILVMVLKTAQMLEVQEECQDSAASAIAVHAWRQRAERALMPQDGKPRYQLLVRLLKEALLIPVKAEDYLLQELRLLEGPARSWLGAAKKVILDRGATGLADVRALLAEGEALPVALEKELEELRERCHLYCVCRQPYDASRAMIACDCCSEWLHYGCVGLVEPDAEAAADHLLPGGASRRKRAEDINRCKPRRKVASISELVEAVEVDRGSLTGSGRFLCPPCRRASVGVKSLGKSKQGALALNAVTFCSRSRSQHRRSNQTPGEARPIVVNSIENLLVPPDPSPGCSSPSTPPAAESKLADEGSQDSTAEISSSAGQKVLNESQLARTRPCRRTAGYHSRYEIYVRP